MVYHRAYSSASCYFHSMLLHITLKLSKFFSFKIVRCISVDIVCLKYHVVFTPSSHLSHYLLSVFCFQLALNHCLFVLLVEVVVPVNDYVNLQPSSSIFLVISPPIPLFVLVSASLLVKYILKVINSQESLTESTILFLN